MLRTAALSLTLSLIAMPLARAQTGVPAKDVTPVVDKAIAYLKSAQAADGSFSAKFGPGVTALVAASLVKNGVSPDDPVVAKALKYLEGSVKSDGGVYAKGLANYTTSVAIMAFAESNKNGKYDTVIKNAAEFIKKIQHGGDEEDPAHGGFSYDGKSGKKGPDLSNTGFALDALNAAGVSKDDPAIKKALAFLTHSQNLPGKEANKLPFAEKTTEDDRGGFTYNPLAGADSDNRTPNGGLRSAGAMTYTGLKSFLYAGVSKEDPRVKAAIDWVRRHYTLEENPGMGKRGLYYYYTVFGKAMTALGEDNFKDAGGKSHNWRQELFDAVKSRQLNDGAWQNPGEQTYMENDKNIATAFALLSLSYCRGK